MNKEITKEDIIELYINQNKTRQEVSNILGIYPYQLDKLKKKFNIVKSKTLENEIRSNSIKSAYKEKDIISKIKATKLERYGNENYNNIDKNKKTKIKNFGSASYHNQEKANITMKERYGNANYNNREKYKQTCLEKYNVDNPFKSSEIRDKAKQTCIDLYGNKTYNNVEKSKQTKLERYEDSNYNNLEKAKQTCLNKYGVDCVFKSKLFKDNNCSIKLKKYGDKNYNNRIEASKTCLDKYGATSPYTSKKVREKMKKTFLSRYGVENYAQSREFKQLFNDKDWVQGIQQKIHDTKKQNNSFNISKPEEDYYQYLLTQYEKDDVIRQYMEDRYPYNCDFYIISEDLFIECNYSWTHGFKQFDENNKKDLELLSMWKSKSNGNDYYANAIYTWTDLDVRKRKIAKENNLNIKFIY